MVAALLQILVWSLFLSAYTTQLTGYIPLLCENEINSTEYHYSILILLY